MGESVFLKVIQPGMMTTVQDLGRTGQARYGVAPGGVLDRGALILGNRLLGNDPGAAALEITLIGPKLSFTSDVVIAVTGGDLGARRNVEPLPLWQPIHFRAGDVFSFDPGAAGLGARAYLCVAGGIDVEPVMGSRSTDLIGGFGGWQGRPLKAGDELPIGRAGISRDAILCRRLLVDPPELSTSHVARVVLGPQADRFTDAGIATFLNSEFSVSSKSNRQGVRLDGPSIAHLHGADLISEGIAHGAIQVPGDGKPIVLLAGRQTVGGYVKIATVIGADLDRFAQLRPGDKVGFEAVSLQVARETIFAHLASIGPNSVIEPALDESEIRRLGGDWDPDGVIRVIEAFERTGAASLSFNMSGVCLNLTRGPSGSIDYSFVEKNERE